MLAFPSSFAFVHRIVQFTIRWRISPLIFAFRSLNALRYFYLVRANSACENFFIEFLLGYELAFFYFYLFIFFLYVLFFSPNVGVIRHQPSVNCSSGA